MKYISVEVDSGRIMRKVMMQTAYAAVRGVADSAEEANEYDEELLRSYYETSRGELVMALGNRLKAGDSGCWQLACADSVGESCVVELSRAIEDCLAGMIMRRWYSLLRLKVYDGEVYDGDYSSPESLVRWIDTRLPAPLPEGENAVRRGLRPGVRIPLRPW